MKAVMITKLADYFNTIPDITAALLYGSLARGQENLSSDVDIAILTRARTLSVGDKLQMIADLELVVGRQVDLVKTTEASSILKHQVIKKGIVLLCTDRKALNQFIVSAVQEYLDLKRTRLPIEKHLKEVSIYG